MSRQSGLPSKWLLLGVSGVVLCMWWLFSSPMPSISQGLPPQSIVLKHRRFYLDGRPTRLFSGAMHYFRIMPEYWRDRLIKLRQTGCNVVETYVPWNLHEENKNAFNYDGILNIRSFIQTAQEVGLYVIVRPGPYICSEWEFGGLPAWLLTDPNMKVRRSYPGYMTAVSSYLKSLFPHLVDLQRSSGGPIIGFQIENEYGVYASDYLYMNFLREEYLRNGVKELLFTSDNSPEAMVRGSLPNVLATANFKSTHAGYAILQHLSRRQPTWPAMVMEYWTGWFDHWGEEHHIMTTEEFEKTLAFIIETYGSFNMYMFHGGTNFGFMNGANSDRISFDKYDYKADVTSYDYDAPLSEAGEPTDKYYVLQSMVAKYQHELVYLGPLPVDTQSPPSTKARKYGTFNMEWFLPLKSILAVSPLMDHENSNLITMEQLDLGNGYGQNFGFIAYRTTIELEQSVLLVSNPIADRAQVFLNGKELAVLDWDYENGPALNKTILLPVSVVSRYLADLPEESGDLIILVENMGRVNYMHGSGVGLNGQLKGLQSPVFVNNEAVTLWKIQPMEFKPGTVKRLVNEPLEMAAKAQGAGLYCTSFTVDPQMAFDTYLDLNQGWQKGVAFINGFNLGRYWSAGPQKRLYIPAPLLHPNKEHRKTDNMLCLFELHRNGMKISLKSKPGLY